MPYFWAKSKRTFSIISSVASELGQTSTQFVHKKQLSNMRLAFLSRLSSPFLYAPIKSKNPRGLSASSPLMPKIVQVGLHLPHFTQASLMAEKLNFDKFCILNPNFWAILA